MLSCNVVKDLLPNYVDGLTCEETGKEIAEHMENCADCRAVYESMTAPIAVEPLAEKSDINFLKKIKRRSWRNIIIASGGILVAVFVLTRIFVIGSPVSSGEISFDTTIYTNPYSKSSLEFLVSEIKWQLDMSLNGDYALVVSDKYDFGPELIILEPRKVRKLFSENADASFGVLLSEATPEGMSITVRLADKDIVFSMDEIIDQYELSYDWNGNVANVFHRGEPSEWDDYDFMESAADEEAFLAGQLADELRWIKWPMNDSGGWQESHGRTHLNTLEELRSVLKNADVPSFKIPTYTPAGYSIESIGFNYYHGPEIREKTPTEVRISTNGNEMSIIKLTEDVRKCISGYNITYINETTGDKLDFRGMFNEFDNRARFSASVNSSVRIPVIDGFDRAIIATNVRMPDISAPHQDNRILSYNYIAASYRTGYIEPYSKDFSRGMDSLEYGFFTDDLNIDEEELIKLVVNLRLVQ